MDPISQGALGAALPQGVSRKETIKTTTWLGVLSGMAPDIDVVIRSSSNPILFLEYHRQFTHALAFIPFGALICAAIFYRWSRPVLNFSQTYLVCLLAYSTHALLDACTTYGTQLFWPFSDYRVAWNNVSVVDPIATLPLLVCVICAYRATETDKIRRYARVGLVWFIGYLLIGVMQNERAEQAGLQLARDRGHVPEKIGAKPGFGNLLLWKTIYEYDNHYYVDAMRAGLNVNSYQGTRVEKLNIAEDFPWLDPQSQQARDLERFQWFSNGYVAKGKSKNSVIDIRYSMLPNEIDPLWGIQLSPNASPRDHVSYITNRQLTDTKRKRLLLMLYGDTLLN